MEDTQWIMICGWGGGIFYLVWNISDTLRKINDNLKKGNLK